MCRDVDYGDINRELRKSITNARHQFLCLC